MTGFVYAIADLHGRFDLLEAALSAIEAHATEPGTVVFMGDYVDRGPESRQIIERLMSGAPAGWHWICLQGNHEDMMVRCYTGRAELGWWLGNGGVQTLVSYGQPLGKHLIPGIVPDDQISWLENLPRMFVDDHRVFVHAGVAPDVPLAEQDDEALIWKLYDNDDEAGHVEAGHVRHVVHGHHQFEDGPLLLAGRTDLDTFAWLTGRIVVGVFADDMPGGPIELIEVIGERDRRFE